ncbi:hypothetical protein D3C86_2263860 [compost metagenome]
MVTSDELIEFVGCEAIGQAIAMSGTRVLGRRATELTCIDSVQGVADDIELVDGPAGPVRVTS